MIEIIKDSIDFYRDHFWSIFSIFFPVFFLDLVTTQLFNSFLITDSSELFIQFFPVMLSFILNCFYTTGLIILFGGLINGNNPPPSQCLKKAFSYLPLFIVIEIITIVLTAAGFILLIIPGIVIGIKLSLSKFYFILSNEMPISAIKQSFDATDGITGTMFVTVILIGIPFVLLRLTVETTLSLLNFSNPIASMVIDTLFGCYAVLFPIIFFRFFCMVKQSNAAEKV